MKHWIAALPFALLAACATDGGESARDRADVLLEGAATRAAEIEAEAADAPRDSRRVGFVSEPGVAGTDPADAAARAALQAVVADPPRRQARRAANRQLVIPSGPVRPELGRPAEMNALILLAAGEGPKPTLLLLHGLPGNERNLDLAQAVRRAGWNVLTFSYRGAWGSEGTFSIRHAIDDARAALAFLRSERATRDYGVDPARIVLAGHSMGGLAAALVAAEDGAAPPLAGLALLDAWDAGATAARVRAAGAEGRAAFIAALDDLGHALGPITAADLADELIRHGDQWDLAARAPALARLPVLLIYATNGLAEQNQALLGAFIIAAADRPRGAPRMNVQGAALDTDHAFADRRIALAVAVVRWLGTVAR